MSSFLLAKAIRTRSTSGNTRLLLLILADAASESGHVTMTIEEMSARANAHRRTITRALEDMIRSRIITGGPDYCLILDDDPLFEVDGVTFAEPEPEPDHDERANGAMYQMDFAPLRLEDVVEPEHLEEARENWQKWYAMRAGSAPDRRDAGAAPPVPPVPPAPPEVPGMPPGDTPIGALLRAAGVEPDPLVPLYWMRPGHQDDVRQLEADTGLTAAQIIETCRDMHLKAGPIRRLTALAPMIAREKRRPR